MGAERANASAGSSGPNLSVLTSLEYEMAGRAVEYSDDRLALQFSAENAKDLRYVASLNAWFIFEGHMWRQDSVLQVWELIRRFCRGVAAATADPNAARSIASRKTVAAIEFLVRADPRHATLVDALDADTWLLNTPCGVIDLSTGDVLGRETARERLMTKTTAASVVT